MGRREEDAAVGPTLYALARAHLGEAAAAFEDFQAFAMADGGGDSRAGSEVRAQVQRNGADEGLANRLFARRSGAAGGEREQTESGDLGKESPHGKQRGPF